MSEERFDRIEVKLDRLEAGQDELRADVSGLKADVVELKADVGGLKADVCRLDARIEELDLHMHVLHEDTLARIAAIPEYAGPTRSEMQQGFAELREIIDRRIVPIETVIRNAIANGKL